MSEIAAAFLDTCRPDGIGAFEQLIRKMSETGCTKLLLTDHHDYGFALGVAGADVDRTVFGDWVQLIANFAECYSRFQRADPDGDDVYLERETRWTWIRECWLGAHGPESGKVVVLFENGIGHMMDLNTGEDPTDELGIYDLTS